MTRPRNTLVSIADTPYYHCINRCVRRAFLCGDDPVSGKSFEHRRTWMLERLALLNQTFAIDLCAYALMSNHYHLVLRVQPERAASWSSYEVATRWRSIFRGPAYLDRFLLHEPLTPDEDLHLNTLIPIWTERLCNLSWYERCLNEYIARQANAEDSCPGRFWEGRFKSEALLDDPALLAAMVYVDLNPIRAGLASSVADSNFTSVQQRLSELAAEPPTVARLRPPLMQFSPEVSSYEPWLLPFCLSDYLELVDITGRAARTAKSGVIDSAQPALLRTLGLHPEEWFVTVAQVRRRHQSFIGAPRRLRQLARERGWHWVRGLAAGRRLYVNANA